MKCQARMVPRRGLLAVLALAPLAVVPAGCEKEAPPAPEIIRPVKMMEIRGIGRHGTREYPGRTKAGQYSEMSFEVPGNVTEFVYNEGAVHSLERIGQTKLIRVMGAETEHDVGPGPVHDKAAEPVEGQRNGCVGDVMEVHEIRAKVLEWKEIVRRNGKDLPNAKAEDISESLLYP